MKKVTVKFIQKQNGGHSLISVIVSSGILILAVGFLATSVENTLSMYQLVARSEKYTEVSELLNYHIIARMKKQLEESTAVAAGNCTNLGAEFRGIMEDRSYMDTNTAIALADLSNIDLNLIPDSLGSYKSAAQSCLHDQTFAPGVSPNISSESQIRFCLLIEAADGNPDRESFLSAPHFIFADVRFNLTDFSTDTNLTCNSYFDNNLHPSRGGKVYYDLYWLVVGSGQYSLQRHKELIYAPTKV